MTDAKDALMAELEERLKYAEARIRNQEVVVDANLKTLCHAQRALETARMEIATLKAMIEVGALSDPVRVKHVARGSTYTVLGGAEVQSAMPINEGDMLMVYRGDDGRLWARPMPEFGDGRFIPLPPGA